MTTTLEVGKRLVELCSQGKNAEAIKELYAKDITSIEAGAPPGMSAETRGIEGVIAKSTWWAENHTVHSAKAEGPWPHGDRFIARFTYDITMKASNQRVTMDEAALYTVADGKIVREEFFYTGG
jgi:ketosteroid isomerase-like protein